MHKLCRQSDFFIVVFSVLCIYVVISFFQTFFSFNLISSDVTNHWQSMVGFLIDN